MLVVGLAITFTGYSLAYYGLTQVRGGNWGLLDLTVPTRWTKEVAATKTDKEANG
jgi:hypothetical protein